MRLLCVGVSHRTAPLPVRERLALADGQVHAALADLRRRWPDAELLLLNTCNRTELYAARALHAHPRTEELLAWLAGQGNLPPDAADNALYALADHQAVQHLFDVAAGLDSQVPGEDQIVAQIKTAHETARNAGSAGPRLADLVAAALHVAKHIRTDTAFSEGKVSIPSVAVEALADRLGDLRDRTVLCIGAGKVGRLLLAQLRRHRCSRVVLLNRSPDRSTDLDVESAPLEDLPGLLETADAVLTSTGSQQPILPAGLLQAAQARRNNRPLLVLDLAVPRDVEPFAANLPGLELLNLDDLDATVQQTLRKRTEHLADAQAITAEHVAEFLASAHIRSVAPTVEALYRRVEQIILDELADAENKFATHDDADEDLAILRRTLRRALRRFCHPATEQLRSEAASGHGQAHAETLRKLFDLDQAGPDPS